MTKKLKLSKELIFHINNLLDTLPIHEALSDDVSYCLKMFQEDPSPFWSRCLIRTVFAEIEGNIYLFKKIALQRHFAGKVIYSLAELSFLDEKNYRLDEKGKVRKETRKISTLANLRFTFAMYAKAYGFNDPTIYGKNDGWEAFQTLQTIRDRLTHPKTIATLYISQDEFNIFLKGHGWFLTTVKKMWELSGPIFLLEGVEDKEEMERILKLIAGRTNMSKGEIEKILGYEIK